MSRRSIIIFILLIVAIAGYFGYTNYLASTAEPSPELAQAPELKPVIWASGKIVPAQRADLSFSLPGQLVEIAAPVGARVEAGAILARQDDLDLRHGLTAAETNLARAQAELDRLLAGPRPEEVAIAGDNVAIAESGLAAAEADLAAARAGVSGAQANVARAVAEIERLLAGARPPEKETAAANLLKVEAALRLAQAEYDKIAWADDVGLSPQALALESATLDYQIAMATYEGLVQGATAAEVAAAQAAVNAARASQSQAEASLARTEAQLKQFEATWQTANSRLALLKEGPTAAEIAVAQTAVNQAEAAVVAAREAVGRATLVAPFAGTVGEWHIRSGEYVLPGTAAVSLGDLNQLQVETSDLRETDVAQLFVDQAVNLTFDALPEAQLPGHIVQIAPMASSGQGGTNYTVIVAFDELDPSLRWGMTAFVNITLDEF
jgi:HlyD family secretion protein